MKFIPVMEPVLGGNELKYVSDCITSSWISSIGKYVEKFETGFSNYCETDFGVATMNGTAALHLALVALNITREDEVIIPNLTFIATANAVAKTGATPVVVDSEEETWNIDVNKIEEKITDKTKAIIVVHLYGHPCDMDKVIEIAKKYNLYVIEDAAEAHGAEYNGKKVGSFGMVGCFSFYGNKIITTGEGGMCVTNNNDLAERMNFLKDHGMSKGKRYWHPEIGYNYRMTNIQAALGVAQLEKIDKIIEIKRQNALLYSSLLGDVEGITLPPETSYAKNVYWMYSILIEDSFPLSRDELMIKFKENDIDSRPFFYPVSVMPPYKTEEKFPVSENLSRKGLNLPSSINLTEEDIKRIVNIIRSCR